jgi:hypothetical protein
VESQTIKIKIRQQNDSRLPSTEHFVLVSSALSLSLKQKAQHSPSATTDTSAKQQPITKAKYIVLVTTVVK